MDDVIKASTLKNAADMDRARVEEVLKSTVEREVLASEPDVAGFSSFHHVVEQVQNAE